MVLALGVVSFAMISIMGLIPVGLSTFRSALNLSVESTIAQKVASDLQRTDFANQSTTQFTLHFDEQGIETTPSAAVFNAEVNPPVPLNTSGIMAPDAPAQTIVIKITNRSEPSASNLYSIVISSDS